METPNIIRSNLLRDYIDYGVGNTGGPWNSEGYGEDTDAGFTGMEVIEAVSSGVWLIVIHFALDSISTQTWQEYKQKSKIRGIVTNNDGNELTGHVWPSEIGFELEDHDHTISAYASLATMGIQGAVIDTGFSTAYPPSPPSPSAAGRRPEHPVQLFFIVRMKTGDRFLIVRDPVGNTAWTAEVVRLSPAINVGAVEI